MSGTVRRTLKGENGRADPSNVTRPDTDGPSRAGDVSVEWYELYRTDGQRVRAALLAALTGFTGLASGAGGLVFALVGIRGDGDVPLIAVPFVVPLLAWVAVASLKSAAVATRAALMQPGRVGLSAAALTIDDGSVFGRQVVIPKDSIAKISLPPVKRDGGSPTYGESAGLPAIKLSLLAESPNCGVFLTAPMSEPSTRANRIFLDGREVPGTRPPRRGKAFQVIWLRTADWTGARALRTWAGCHAVHDVD